MDGREEVGKDIMGFDKEVGAVAEESRNEFPGLVVLCHNGCRQGKLLMLAADR